MPACNAGAELVVGPAGPNYGGRDANGTVEGADEVFIFPGLDGFLIGLANPLVANE